MKVEGFFVTKNNLILDCLKVINSSGIGTCILVDNQNEFLQMITDGDIRRFLMSGGLLDSKVRDLVKKNSVTPIWVSEEETMNSVLSKMQAYDIQCVPVLNKRGVPTEIIFRKDLENPIFLSTPHTDSVIELEYIRQAFKTNWITSLGPNVENFEKELATYIESKYALAVSSGTAALHLALAVLGVTKGDIVFCSSLTFVASANPIIYVGATPVFIDSDFETWNMSPQALKRAFEKYSTTGRLPKAVIVTNLYGQSAAMDSIKDICEYYNNTPIIEDAAESLGATYKEKHSGTFGVMGAFSFNGNKIITTSSGGMLVSEDSSYIEKARFLSTQAKDSADFYLHTQVGYNYRMSNVLAGIGRGQLQVLSQRVEARRKIFNRYKENLQDINSFIWMPEPPGYYSTHWLSCFLFKGRVKKDFISFFHKALLRKGVEARRIWKPMHTQPLYQYADYWPHEESQSVSDFIFEQGMCLPSSSSMLKSEQNRVIEVIRDALA